MDDIEQTHAFCPLHKIGYNIELDPTCPQCLIQRVAPPEPLDFDTRRQKPVDASGNVLHPRTLKPIQ